MARLFSTDTKSAKSWLVVQDVGNLTKVTAHRALPQGVFSWVSVHAHLHTRVLRDRAFSMERCEWQNNFFECAIRDFCIILVWINEFGRPHTLSRPMNAIC